MYTWYFQFSSDTVDLLPQKLPMQLRLSEQAYEDGETDLQTVIRNRLANGLAKQSCETVLRKWLANRLWEQNADTDIMQAWKNPKF